MLLRARIPVTLGSGLVNKRKELRALMFCFLICLLVTCVWSVAGQFQTVYL